MILLNGSNIKKMFLDETLFDSVSFNVDSNDKIGFIGVNGAGKSTLFKIITGDMDYDEGEIFKNKGLRVGYLDQYSVNGTPTGRVVSSEYNKIVKYVKRVANNQDIA